MHIKFELCITSIFNKYTKQERLLATSNVHRLLYWKNIHLIVIIDIFNIMILIENSLHLILNSFF